MKSLTSIVNVQSNGNVNDKEFKEIDSKPNKELLESIKKGDKIIEK